MEFRLMNKDTAVLDFLYDEETHNIDKVTNLIHPEYAPFALSLVFYLGVGFPWILQKKPFNKIILLGLFIIIANVICETVMGFMNTTDILDAIYGIAGTFIGFCYFFVINKYGLEDINEER